MKTNQPAKRVLSILLVICMLLALAACTSNEPASNNSNTSNSNAAQSETSEKSVDNKETLPRVDLIFYVMGDAPKDQAMVEEKINEILLDKFNATLEFRFSTWTDFQQKYSNELTTGGPDLIYVAGWLNYGTLAKAGAFLELDSLLDTYGPELKALIGEDSLNMCRVNGELYAIPNAWPEYVSMGITYREDLRAKYNLPAPDSLSNMESYFMGIKENEPNQPILRVTTEESQGFQTAFDAAAAVLGMKYSWVHPNGLFYGLAANYDTPSDIVDYWYSDDFVEDCKLLKRWADLGFWSKSALSDTNDSFSYKNGLCVAQVAGMNPNKQITAIFDFEKEHPDWISKYIAYGEVTGVIYPGHATQNGTAIVRGSKNAERAMMVLNYLMTNETLNKLVQCGIEGVHYNIDANGFYQEILEKYEDFKYENFNTWNLRNSKYKLLQRTDVELERMFSEYRALGEKTKFPNVNIFDGFNEDYEEYQVERTAVSNIMRQYLAPLQAGFVSDVDAAVTEFRQKMEEAGLKTVRDGYIEQWLAYCSEYGYK